MSKAVKQILAICDPEAAYVYRLLEYMNKKELPFEVRAFTDPEKLKSFGGREKAALLLVDERVLEDWMREVTAKVIVLSEGNVFAEWQEFPSIYKYQSSEAIVREAVCYYGEVAGAEAVLPAQRYRTELIGIYSPVRRTGRTTFALTLGQVLSETKKVLYLNMEEYAGFSQLTGGETMTDLSDIMYFVREGSGRIFKKLEQTVRRIGDLYYIPPAVYPIDLRAVTGEEWTYLLQVIEEQGTYETLILDLGDHIQGIAELLGMCSRIYSPQHADTVSRAKWMQYEYMLGMTGQEQVLDRTKRLDLPRQKYCPFEELKNSPMADYVKTLLGKER